MAKKRANTFTDVGTMAWGWRYKVTQFNNAPSSFITAAQIVTIVGNRINIQILLVLENSRVISAIQMFRIQSYPNSRLIRLIYKSNLITSSTCSELAILDPIGH